MWEYRYSRLSGEEKKRVLGEIRDALEREDKVLLTVVFGSFTELESFRDIDVAVYSLDASLDYLAKLNAELELRLGIPLDLVPLTELDPRFKLHVLTKGEVVLEKTPGLYEALLSQAHDEALGIELEQQLSRHGDAES